MQTLLWCLNSPCVQSHASTSVHKLKITNTGSHTIVWMHENTAHTDAVVGMGSAALAAAVQGNPGKVTQNTQGT